MMIWNAGNYWKNISTFAMFSSWNPTCQLVAKSNVKYLIMQFYWCIESYRSLVKPLYPRTMTNVSNPSPILFSGRHNHMINYSKYQYETVLPSPSRRCCTAFSISFRRKYTAYNATCFTSFDWFILDTRSLHAKLFQPAWEPAWEDGFASAIT